MKRPVLGFLAWRLESDIWRSQSGLLDGNEDTKEEENHRPQDAVTIGRLPKLRGV